MKQTAWKILLGIVCILATTFTLAQYAKLVQHLLDVKYNGLFELLIVCGMILFQLILIYKNSLHTILEYFYRMLLVSLIGSLLLWPLLIANKYYLLSDIANLAFFFAVVLAMFFIHKNIVEKMKLPHYLSYTYILYRIIILLFIL